MEQRAYYKGNWYQRYGGVGFWVLNRNKTYKTSVISFGCSI
jgi:hypothetical protein